MSLFGSLMGDLEEDPIFGSHMNSMRQMNSMMNSIFNNDPFGGLFGGFGGNMLTAAPMMPQNAMMPFGGFMPPMARGFPGMPSMNMMPTNASFTSTSYVSMTSGPDGRPQIYQASSSTKHGPHGVVETKKTVQDSRTGIKKMAIGHHIGERGHIVEREQNLREGTEEERQDFINLEEEEAEDFNREFMTKVNRHSGGPSIQCIETGPPRPRELPAIMPAQPSGGQPKRRRRNTEEEEQEEAQQEEGRPDAEPIIELPESPCPSPEPAAHDGPEVEEVTERVRPEEDHLVRDYSRGGNVLGVQPRKPIRTHQASPLATMGSSGSHPYNAQQSRKAHRPMKGTGQYHNNSGYQQYERDN